MRHILPLALPLALTITGCKVVDAPEALEELVVFGFTGFEEEAVQDAAADQMDTLADELGDALLEGYRVDDLTLQDLLDGGVDVQDDEVRIMGASAKVVLDAKLQDVAETWTWTRMDQVFASTVEFDIRSEDGDRACFLSRECRSWGYDAHRKNDNGFFGTSEQDFRREFGWATLDDGTEAFVMRDLAPTPADISVPIVAVDQQYAYTIFLERGARTVQVGTFWVDARAIGVELPDAFALDWAVDGMNTDAEAILAFIER